MRICLAGCVLSCSAFGLVHAQKSMFAVKVWDLVRTENSKDAAGVIFSLCNKEKITWVTRLPVVSNLQISN